MLIIGASGFGREVLDLTRVVRSSSRDWAVGGFLDADPAALDGYGVDLPILGDPSTYKPGENDRFICAIGDPATRLGICRQIKDRGGQFITLIHPNVDRKLLSTLIEVYDGGPAGIQAIAAAVGEDRGTLEDLYEPYLLQMGFLQRTPRGRVATRRAYDHLGYPPPAGTPGALFES